MIMTLSNLPYSIMYKDIKALIHSECGPIDIILDTLVSDKDNTKTVNVGLAGEEDAALFMRKLHGMRIGDRRLIVARKVKQQSGNNQRQHNEVNNTVQNVNQQMTNYYQAASQQVTNWSQNQALQYGMNQNASGMVPAAANFGTMKANQSAYYVMNQTNYPAMYGYQFQTPSATAPAVGYPMESYQNPASTSSSNNVWCQPPAGFQNTQQNNGPQPTWDNNWASRRDGEDNKRDVKWNHESGRQNDRESKRDSMRSNDGARRDRERASRWTDNRDMRSADNRESRRDDNRDSFRSTQSGRPSRDNDSSHRNRDQDYSHSRDRSSNAFYNQRQESHRSRSPIDRKRPSQTSFSNAPKPKARDDPVEIAKNWREQVACRIAKDILNERSFRYKVNDFNSLRAQVRQIVRARVERMFASDITIHITEMNRVCDETFKYHTQWSIMKKALLAVGGTVKQLSSDGKKLVNVSTNPREAPTKNPQPKNRPPAMNKLPQYPGGAGKNAKPKNKPGASKPNKLPQYPGGAMKKPPPKKNQAPITKKIPNYLGGDKKLDQQTKAMSKLPKAGKYDKRMLSMMSPYVREMLYDEIEKLCDVVIAGVCEEAEPNIDKFVEHMRTATTVDLKNSLKVTVARRMMIAPMPLAIRVFSQPILPRVVLENYLTQFNVKSLRKSNKRSYYIAHVGSVDDHDAMCLMKPFQLDGSIVQFKTFHIAGKQSKATKDELKKERLEFMQEHIDHAERMFGPDTDDDDESDDEYEDDGNEVKNEPETMKMEAQGEENKVLLQTKVGVPEQDFTKPLPNIDFSEDIDINNINTKSENSNADVKVEGDNAKTEVTKVETEVGKVETQLGNEKTEDSKDEAQVSKVETEVGKVETEDCNAKTDNTNTKSEADNKIDRSNDVQDSEGNEPPTDQDMSLLIVEKPEASVISVSDDDIDKNKSDIVDDIDLADVNEDDLEDW
ncbi:uncharacterized protein LOC142984131 [Anticarsia gemmatalis]|uniref:uncharacterized protein LOC142984131 n=1 Tax=Anticarsia gemmatalis TaxID=129554 RepID=UPI003F774E8A